MHTAAANYDFVDYLIVVVITVLSLKKRNDVIDVSVYVHYEFNRHIICA